MDINNKIMKLLLLVMINLHAAEIILTDTGYI